MIAASFHFPVILSEYNKIIAANLTIEKGFLNEAEEIRYWRLPNIAMVPCGGTHVRSTTEIGAIDLKRDLRSRFPLLFIAEEIHHILRGGATNVGRPLRCDEFTCEK